jgi:uncharacterized protein (DUF885 family)
MSERERPDDPAAAALVNDAIAAARRLADRFWEQFLELEPLTATQVGDERFDDRMPDPSEAGLARARSIHSAALHDLEAIDRSALDPVLRGTLDILDAVARRALAEIDSRIDRLRHASHLYGPGTLLADLGSLQRADTPERLERYLTRLSGLPAYLDAAMAVLQDGVGLGVTVPGVVADRLIAQLDRLIAAGVEGSPALRPMAEGDADGRDRVAAVVRDDVLPSYERYLAALRDYRPHATETLGISALPGGDAMYAAEILGWTTLPLDAGEVHRIGLEEMAGIDQERAAIARSLGHESPRAAIEAYRASGRGVAGSREEMVRMAEDQVRRSWDAAVGYFGRLPSTNCEVRAVEEYREKDMPSAFYQAPTGDGSRAGVYYVNTSDLPERPLHHLATTTYHEATPGHHFQVMLELELADRPPLRRFGGILAGSAFIEGWGLYSERLADEMGLFLDEYERLGMLDAQGLRASRLIVDTGLHAMGWDRERAVQQMMDGAGTPRVDAEIEVDRYVALPAQALAYKIGQREIEGWRRVTAERQGSSFDLRTFHDRLLALGSLPLPALRREMADST